MVSRGVRAAINSSGVDVDGNAEEGGRVVTLPHDGKRTYLYFFSVPGRIKIGITKNIQQRLADVGAHLEFEPSVLGFIRADLKFERHVHEILSKHRIRNEWFSDCAEVREAMNKVLAGDLLGFQRAAKKPDTNFSPSELADNLFGRVCKTIWPFKTAEHLAAATGRAVRTAAYEVSGEREPSAQALVAVMNAMTPPARPWKPRK